MAEKVAECSNPHWIGDSPAWDITLSNGVVHKDVTHNEIRLALGELYSRGKLHLYSTYIDVVRQCHIESYNLWHTMYCV